MLSPESMDCRLNHLHLKSSDKYHLASWYADILNFQIIEDLEKRGERGGPLLISGDSGKTYIAIFNSKDAEGSFAISAIPAFELTAEDFVDFHRKQIQRDPGTKVYDHMISHSIYLIDPMGSKIELVCNDYEKATELLKKNSIPSLQMNPVDDEDYRDLK